MMPLHLGLALDTSGSMDVATSTMSGPAVIKFLNANEHAADIDARRLRHRSPRGALRSAQTTRG